MTFGIVVIKLLTNKPLGKEESNDEFQTKEIKDEKLEEMNNKVIQIEGLVADLTNQLNETRDIWYTNVSKRNLFTNFWQSHPPP